MSNSCGLCRDFTCGQENNDLQLRAMGPPSSPHHDIPLRPLKTSGISELLPRSRGGTGYGDGSPTSVGTSTSDGQSSLRRAHTVAQGPNTSKTNIGRRVGKERTQSLLRMKNSAEVLWQRSMKRSNNIPESVPEFLPSREGKHFTVGNVGNNGRLYLRYVIIM